MKAFLLSAGLATASLLSTGSFAAALKGGKVSDPATVAEVDLDRYLGKWYEIASYPQPFSRGCTGTTATYTLRDDGNIDVLNQCNLGSLDGQLIVANGVARSVDPSNAKLKVRFPFPGEEGDYWIIELGTDYEYAVVSGPGREAFWILSRTPTMDSDVFNGILERAEADGFDLSRLQWTPQRTK